MPGSKFFYLGGWVEIEIEEVTDFFSSCPNYEQCRCDLYGWCGPLFSGDTLQPVTKATH